MTGRTAPAKALHVALIAGEPSGDILGGRLMAALRAEHGPHVRFSGVGGENMEAQGLESLFPLSEITLMGLVEIVVRLRSLYRHVRDTANSVIRSDADLLVMIDSPEFTHAVARRVRKARPDLPIVDYVSPTVWAWRPWRARKMRSYVDHILAVLPFEPEVHRRLGGPACTYVGHPLMGRLNELRREGRAAGSRGHSRSAPVLAVLPGSRRNEVRRLMQPFGETVARLLLSHPDLRVVLPAVPSVRDAIEAGLAGWPLKPEIVSGEAAKFAAFHSATAALAASGTVSLELALARVPMAIAYRVDRVAASLRWLVVAHSVVMPNLVLGRNAVPEFIQDACTPENLERALLPLLEDTPERRAQLAAFEEVEARMATGGEDPSVLAAREVLAILAGRRSAEPATSSSR